MPVQRFSWEPIDTGNSINPANALRKAEYGKSMQLENKLRQKNINVFDKRESRSEKLAIEELTRLEQENAVRPLTLQQQTRKNELENALKAKEVNAFEPREQRAADIAREDLTSKKFQNEKATETYEQEKESRRLQNILGQKNVDAFAAREERSATTAENQNKLSQAQLQNIELKHTSDTLDFIGKNLPLVDQEGYKDFYEAVVDGFGVNKQFLLDPSEATDSEKFKAWKTNAIDTYQGVNAKLRKQIAEINLQNAQNKGKAIENQSLYYQSKIKENQAKDSRVQRAMEDKDINNALSVIKTITKADMSATDMLSSMFVASESGQKIDISKIGDKKLNPDEQRRVDDAWKIIDNKLFKVGASNPDMGSTGNNSENQGWPFFTPEQGPMNYTEPPPTQQPSAKGSAAGANITANYKYIPGKGLVKQ